MNKRTLIAIPCMDMIHTDFVRSLIEMEKPGNVACGFIQNTLIYNARNMIAHNAIEDGFDRVLWLDSDMILPPDTMHKLSETVDYLDADFVSALYFRRKSPHTPVVYKDVSWAVNIDGTVEVKANPYEEYPNNSLFRIEGAGFGCCMTSAILLREMVERYGAPFTPLMGMGEDLAFCWRARQLGFDLACDSRVMCGHIGQHIYTEDDNKQ